MRPFRHMTFHYRCGRCGQRGQSTEEQTIGPFELVAVATFALPIVVVAVLPPWRFPWYAAGPALSAELLALFAAGQAVEFGYVLAAASAVRCHRCGGRLDLDGRTYDPDAAGDRRPTAKGAVVIAAFVVLNGLFWWAYATGRLVG